MTDFVSDFIKDRMHAEGVPCAAYGCPNEGIMADPRKSKVGFYYLCSGCYKGLLAESKRLAEDRYEFWRDDPR